jgi:uncharacterized protein YabE (DUF348 family)
MYFLLVALLLVVTLTGFASNSKLVTISVDGRNYTVNTHAVTPKAALKEIGIVLGPKDEVILTTKRLEAGSALVVRRAIPVQILTHGNTQIVYTAKQTVREVARQYGYNEPTYEPTVSGETPITANMTVQIAAITKKEINEDEVIPISVVTEPDPQMIRGEEVIVQYGTPGERKVHAYVVYADGVESGRELISEEIITPAQPTIKKVGSRDTVETSRGDVRFQKVVRMEATAYLPGDGDGRGITATGIRAQWGVVAVDPSRIPLGTRLYIPGYGVAIAADTGGAIAGDRIDLCMEDYSQAIHYGRQMVDVYVLS